MRARTIRRMTKDKKQMELPLRPWLRVIQGGGEKVEPKLKDRNAVARVLIEAGADVLLRRISAERAEEIEERVDEILGLFDRVDVDPTAFPILQARLDALEELMKETRATRRRRQAPGR
jgi:hypothetical protein